MNTYSFKSRGVLAFHELIQAANALEGTLSSRLRSEEDIEVILSFVNRTGEPIRLTTNTQDVTVEPEEEQTLTFEWHMEALPWTPNLDARFPTR